MTFSPRDAAAQHLLISRCLQVGSRAAEGGDVPIGALVVSATGELLGEGFNTRERDADPTGHAELNALRAAAESVGSWRLVDCTLAVTVEPCAMCAGAIIQARISTVVFGAWDAKAGASGSVFDILREPRLNHWVEVHPGIRSEECSDQLATFFTNLRN